MLAALDGVPREAEEVRLSLELVPRRTTAERVRSRA
jgi:hypothetical protein